MMGRAPHVIDVQDEYFPGALPITHPAGHLDSCNPRGDNVAVFRVDRETGGLEFTGHPAPFGDPSCIVLLDLNKVG
jgi:6-phosphogluconolactonase